MKFTCEVELPDGFRYDVIISAKDQVEAEEKLHSFLKFKLADIQLIPKE